MLKYSILFGRLQSVNGIHETWPSLGATFYLNSTHWIIIRINAVMLHNRQGIRNESSIITPEPWIQCRLFTIDWMKWSKSRCKNMRYFGQLVFGMLYTIFRAIGGFMCGKLWLGFLLAIHFWHGFWLAVSSGPCARSPLGPVTKSFLDSADGSFNWYICKYLRGI